MLGQKYVTKTFQLKLQMNVVFLKLKFQSKRLLSASCTGLKNFVCRNFSLSSRNWSKNLKVFKKETILFGDFNIDTLKDSTDKMKHESMLTAYNFQIRNFEPTRVTPKTKTCLDHFISSNHFSNKTLKTTISDHYSVLLEISDATKEMNYDTDRSRR